MFTQQDFDQFYKSIRPLSHLDTDLLTDGLDMKTTSRIDMNKAQQIADQLSRVDIPEERIRCLASGTEVTQSAFPELFRAIEYCLEVFGLQSIQFFISDHSLTPTGIGADTGLITLPSRCLKILTLPELISVIGHEIGHLACNDCVERAYSVEIINTYRDACRNGNEKTGKELFTAVNRAYKTLQNTEYAADRAGLLCCQNLEASQTALLKVVSNNKDITGSVDIEEYINVHSNSTRKMPWMHWKNRPAAHPFNPSRLLEMKLAYEQKIKPFLEQQGRN